MHQVKRTFGTTDVQRDCDLRFSAKMYPRNECVQADTSLHWPSDGNSTAWIFCAKNLLLGRPSLLHHASYYVNLVHI